MGFYQSCDRHIISAKPCFTVPSFKRERSAATNNTKGLGYKTHEGDSNLHGSYCKDGVRPGNVIATGLSCYACYVQQLSVDGCEFGNAPSPEKVGAASGRGRYGSNLDAHTYIYTYYLHFAYIYIYYLHFA
jgi:hypothetical protein